VHEPAAAGLTAAVVRRIVVVVVVVVVVAQPMVGIVATVGQHAGRRG